MLCWKYPFMLRSNYEEYAGVESADPQLPRLAISKATFMQCEVVSEKIGRLREEVGVGGSRLYQGGVL